MRENGLLYLIVFPAKLISVGVVIPKRHDESAVVGAVGVLRVGVTAAVVVAGSPVGSCKGEEGE